MLDFVLGAGLAGLAVRGWVRGFVREALDLVGLVLGIWVAFTLGRPLGDFISDQFGVSSEVARIGSGILLFVLFGVAMGIGAHFLSRVMRLPGLNLANRIGGSAVAALWGVALILVIINVGGVLPLPDSWEEQVEGSTVVQAIAGDNAVPQRLFEALGDDGILASLAVMQDLFGSGRAVPQGDEVLEIPPAPADELRQVRGDVDLVTDRVNEMRVANSVGALLAAQPLSAVAESRAVTMYTAGRISRDTPIGDSVSNDIAMAGILLEIDGEALALATTTRAGIDALFADPGSLGLLSAPQFDRVGVSVVAGPTGVLLVLVLGG
ncbi:MAG: CvpA family protein [Acidimicrobiia bacterium]